MLDGSTKTDGRANQFLALSTFVASRAPAAPKLISFRRLSSRILIIQLSWTLASQPANQPVAPDPPASCCCCRRRYHYSWLYLGTLARSPSLPLASVPSEHQARYWAANRQVGRPTCDSANPSVADKISGVSNRRARPRQTDQPTERPV